MKNLVVLTASIEPGSVASLKRVDWNQRRDDYRAAVEFYCASARLEESVILLVENTEADVSDLEKLAAKKGHRLSVISYREDMDVSLRGKGNGEALMFERVVDWIATSGSRFSRVAKVTGRLKIGNAFEIVNELPYDEQFFAARIYSDLSFVDTKFFVADPLTWTQYLTGLEPLVRESEGKYLEHAVGLSAARMRYEGVSWVPFRRMPAVRGVSGSTGQRYGSARDKLRNLQSVLTHNVSRGGFI